MVAVAAVVVVAAVVGVLDDGIGELVPLQLWPFCFDELVPLISSE